LFTAQRVLVSRDTSGLLIRVFRRLRHRGRTRAEAAVIWIHPSRSPVRLADNPSQTLHRECFAWPDVKPLTCSDTRSSRSL